MNKSSEIQLYNKTERDKTTAKQCYNSEMNENLKMKTAFSMKNHLKKEILPQNNNNENVMIILSLCSIISLIISIFYVIFRTS